MNAPRPSRPADLACPSCGQLAEFLPDSSILYGRDFGPLYICRPCDARVGCHPRTTNPLGALATRETRDARIAAHAAFDALWRLKLAREGGTKSRSRGAGYRWLAQQLGIDPSDCHIGMMDDAMARRVIKICRPYTERRRRRINERLALRAGIAP